MSNPSQPSLSQEAETEMTHPSSPSEAVQPKEKTKMMVGMLFAVSGQYEEYRARPCEVYQSVDIGKAEGDRRNALVVLAREKIEELWELENSEEDGDWELAGKRRTRLLNKLRRDTNDPEIESHEISDLVYSITEARLVK